MPAHRTLKQIHPHKQTHTHHVCVGGTNVKLGCFRQQIVYARRMVVCVCVGVYVCVMCRHWYLVYRRVTSLLLMLINK